MPKPLRAVLLEDSEADAELVLRELRAAGIDVAAVRVETEAAFAAALSPEVDLVLADYTLPEFDGGRALDDLKASGLDIPFLLVTRTLREEEAVAFMLRGAFAAVLKERLAGLAPLVTRALAERELRRENRRIHETLESEASRRRTVEESMTAGLVGFDALGKINHVNRAFCELVGFSRDELLGMAPPFPFWRPEERAELGAMFRRKLETGEGPPTLEIVGQRRDGGALAVSIQVSPVFGDEGKPNGLVCLVNDVAEKRRAEESARRVKRALLTLSRCNDALVRSTSEDELFRRVCEVAVSEGGYRMAWVGLIRNDPRKSVAVAAHAGHESGYLETAAITWADDERGRGPTGSAIRTGAVVVARDIATDPRMEPWRRDALAHGYLSSIALPLKDGEAAFGALTLYSSEKDAFDSEEMRLLCELADDLAYGVAAMRARAEKKALEEQLLHAQKLESVGTLAGGVAHDFNNILMVILANCGFLMPSFSADDPRRGDLEEVRAAAERAVGLTRQLLLFSRRQASNPKVVDLNVLVGNLQKMLRRLIGEHIAVKEALSPDPVRVLADPGQLEQVVTNLAVNARDAMPGGGELAIRTRRVPASQSCEPGTCAEGGFCVRLEVQDTGCGMSAEVLARVFEPFFTTKAVGQGTGLGLAAVYGIVKKAGGGISVRSSPGAGSTFTIDLPEAAGEAAEAPEAAAAPAAGGMERILLVEDDDALRRADQRVLREKGYRVITARDGREALSALKDPAERVDLLVADVVMPTMGGFALAREAASLRPGLKTLFVSGYPERAGEESEPRPTGELLQKPVSPETLLLKVRETLDRPPKG